ncbi:permease [Oleiphilus messinensis]|uniref:Permease n=1 Tax=Oleiphilus messinensis TaxID=141451 RepID=A0A1Y0I4W5_9GAMM|nr:hypothetical protein [Oleiphilus messinensis]ARU54494.1 permease [Oleiphilus messinensis]
MTLLLIKLITTIATVLALSWIAERVGTKIAGILAGFPLGTAIVLFFIAFEQTPEFAARAAPATVAGFTLVLITMAAYSLLTRLEHLGKWLAPAGSLMLFTALTFTISGITALAGIDMNLYLCVAISIGSVLLFHQVIFHPLSPKSAPSLEATNQKPSSPPKITVAMLFLRAGVAASLVLIITGLAYIMDARQAGFMSAFPVTFFPLLCIVHWNYGAAAANTLLRYYPLGLLSLISYTMVIAITYPGWGLVSGTALALVTATIVSVVVLRISRSSR